LLKNSDGTIVPVAGATIDAFRMDIKGRFNTRTGPDGVFVFAGLPSIGTYIVAFSSPKAKPQVITNVRAGGEIEYEIVLEPGDGKRLTREEAQVSLPKPSNAENANELMGRKFREGNDALQVRNYDEAIKLYDEGLVPATAKPEALAVFLTNKSSALRGRGLEKYNNATNTLDAAKKSAQVDLALRDFREAAESASRAVEMIKGQSIPANEIERGNQRTTKFLAYRARADAMYLFVTKVDPAQAATGLAAFQEYIEEEDDPLQKSKAELSAARMLLEVRSIKSAVEQYRHILVSDPKNLEAIFGYGLSLYQSGERDRFPEAESYLQSFLEQASGDDPLRQTAAETLEKLKAIK
jgi:tetratricopeptide (TPR) repeat protein